MANRPRIRMNLLSMTHLCIRAQRNKVGQKTAPRLDCLWLVDLPKFNYCSHYRHKVVQTQHSGSIPNCGQWFAESVCRHNEITRWKPPSVLLLHGCKIALTCDEEETRAELLQEHYSLQTQHQHTTLMLGKTTITKNRTMEFAESVRHVTKHQIA